MEFFGLTLSLSDLGTIVAMLISIISLMISILVFLRNRQRDKANVKIEFVKNDIKTGGENKALDSYINLKNIGGLSTTIEKIDAVINDKLLKVLNYLKPP
jgi:signal transduction histidine kinase